MTTERAHRLAGSAAILAGALFVIVQLVHPEDSLEAMTSDRWLVAHILTFLFPVFGLLGLTGIQLRQLEQSGRVGLVGSLGLFGAFVLMVCFGFYEAFIAPVLATEAPAYAVEALGLLEGESGPTYLGTMYQINGALYLLGGLTFAVATLRARVYPRWAGGLVLAGLLATASTAIVPAMARPSAVVFGLGFAALGLVSARLSSDRG